MTLPVVLQSKTTNCIVTMWKSFRFPTGGSLPRPYNGVSDGTINSNLSPSAK